MGINAICKRNIIFLRKRCRLLDRTLSALFTWSDDIAGFISEKLHTIKTSVACVYACVASVSCKMQFCDI